MTTAVWACVRDQGATWLQTETCPHGVTRQIVHFTEFVVSAAQVQAAAAPDKLHQYHLTRFDHDCQLVLSPIQAEDLTHAA